MLSILKEHNIPRYEEITETLEAEKSVALVQCTGSGKSYVALQLVLDKYERQDVLYIAPSRDILRAFEKLPENNHKYTDYMTYAKLSALAENDLLNISMKYQLIVFDEMHRTGAEKWGQAVVKVMTHSKSSQKFLGLSATPIRYLDNSRNMVEELFEGRQVTGPTVPEAIRMGILPVFHYVSVYFDIEQKFNDYHNRLATGVLSPLFPRAEKLAELELSMSNVQKIDDIVKKRVGLSPKGKWIVFAESFQDLEDMDQNIKLWFGDSANIFKIASRFGYKRNDASIAEFTECPELSVMVCINMFNEGIHIEGVEGIVMLHKTTSPNRWMQWIGRALSAGNKDGSVMILDLVANCNNVRSYMRERTMIQELARDSYNEKEKDRLCIVEDYTVGMDELFSKLDSILVGSNSPWQEWEDKVLRDNSDKSPEYIHENLLPHRTAVAIKSRLGFLGLTKEYLSRDALDFKTYPERETILREQYPLVGPSIPAFKGLKNITYAAIAYKAHGLGLHKLPSSQLTGNQRIERARLLIQFNEVYYGFTSEEFEKFLFWYPIAGSRGEFRYEGSEQSLASFALMLGVGRKRVNTLTSEERFLRMRAIALYYGDLQRAHDIEVIYKNFGKLKTDIPELKDRWRPSDIRDIAGKLGFNIDGMMQPLFALEGTLLDLRAHPESEGILRKLYPIAGARIGYFKGMTRFQITGIARRLGLLRTKKRLLTSEQLLVRALNIAEFDGSFLNLTATQIKDAVDNYKLQRKEISELVGCSVEDIWRLFTELKITKAGFKE